MPFLRAKAVAFPKTTLFLEQIWRSISSFFFDRERGGGIGKGLQGSANF